MSDQFVAEIRIFSFNFAPRGWAQCNGQIMPISQNTALFSLLGTTYGGNGTSNFALPNLMGLASLHVGRNQPGPGLSVYTLGEQAGAETVTLLPMEMPIHTHGVATSDVAGTLAPGTSTQLGKSSKGGLQSSTSGLIYATTGGGVTANAQMSPQALGPAGSSLPHNNMMPYLTLNYCIALQGVFPARN